MDWKDLAPWIAIAITLILSILVPLFTQIANNAHQSKMQKEKIEYEKVQEKEIVYKAFLQNVGAVIIGSSGETLKKAGESFYQIYLYAPSEWWKDLDLLSLKIRSYLWDDAEKILQKLSKEITKVLNNNKGKNQ